MAKQPAWQLLIHEGWFHSRAEAERWILAGSVFAGGQRVRSAGQLLDPKTILDVRGANQKYISKGGLKLEGALSAFGLNIAGRVCLDAGASTGGFTDCLVKHGAARVYAVDVGFGQLAGSLRQCEAVVNLEKTNIGDASLLTLSPRPTLGTVDLSYLSLRKAVPLYREILGGQGDLLCLVKPLFEIEDAQARRTGVIPEEAYAPLLRSLCDDFAAAGYGVRGICHSPVTGNNATIEFFLWLNFTSESLESSIREEMILSSVEKALQLPAFKKTP